MFRTFCILFALSYLVALGTLGYLGVEHELSPAWGLVAVILALFQFSLPLVLGAFYGATEVLGWHWAWAALFSIAGLTTMAPICLTVLYFFKARINATQE